MVHPFVRSNLQLESAVAKSNKIDVGDKSSGVQGEATETVTEPKG